MKLKRGQIVKCVESVRSASPMFIGEIGIVIDSVSSKAAPLKHVYVYCQRLGTKVAMFRTEIEAIQ